MSVLQEKEQSRQEWLESLKEGDVVAIRKGSFGYGYYVLHKIEKITKSRRFKLSGMGDTQFSNNGSEMGKKDTWSPRLSMEPVTQKILDEIRRKKILEEINRVDFKSMPLEMLEEVYSAIKKDGEAGES